MHLKYDSYTGKSLSHQQISCLRYLHTKLFYPILHLCIFVDLFFEKIVFDYHLTADIQHISSHHALICYDMTIRME